ncbi:MAG: hypothetical protein EA409_01445 [Saprospirales bacterium]|nr:MAG: hypothetical protein EA409_01445 [Saprospirales bacterium]
MNRLLPVQLILTLLLLFFGFSSFAQDCNDPPPALCPCDVEIICGFQALDGYCLDMPPNQVTSFTFVGCPNNVIDNPAWFAFVAGEEFLDMDIIPTNCSGFGSATGIHWVIYTGTPECSGSGAACVYSGLTPELTSCGCPGTGPQNISIATIPGQTYYVVIDGCGGSQCDIEIVVNEGGEPPSAGVITEFDLSEVFIPEFSGPDTICLGAEGFSFSINPPEGAAFSIWEFPDGEIVVTPQGVFEIDIPSSYFEEEGPFELCVSVANNCDTSAVVCREFFVLQIAPEFEEDEICQYEDYNWDFFIESSNLQPGIHEFSAIRIGSFGCEFEGILELTIHDVNDDNPTPLFEVICEQDVPFFLHGQQFSETGEYEIIIQSINECDSFLNLELFVLGIDLLFEDPPICVGGMFTYCPSDIIINPSPADVPGELEVIYRWTQVSTGTILQEGPNEFCLEADLSIFLDDVEEFQLQVFMQYEGLPDPFPCESQVYTVFIDLDDFLPDEPEFAETDPVCLGDIVSVSIENVNPDLFYVWEISAPGNTYESAVSGSGETIEILFFEAGSFLVCASIQNSCGEGEQACTTIEVNDLSSSDPGPDVATCNLEYVMVGEGSNGFWTVVDSPPGGQILFSDINSPNSVITANEFGTYLLSWTEVLGDCMEESFVSITFSSPPQISDLVVECNPVQTDFEVSFTIIGGQAPYTVTTGNGTIEGDEFISDLTPSGDIIQIVIADDFGCISDTIQATRTCDCFTETGTMDLSPLSLCTGDCIDGSDFYLGGEELDPNDTTMYVLHTSSGPALSGSTVIGVSSTGEFCFEDLDIEEGRTYYISFVVGDNDGNDLVDLTDPCLAVSAGTPVTWHAQPISSAGGDDNVCGFLFDLNASPSVGEGIWRLVSGPGSVVFGDESSPSSGVEVDECGTYTFRWSEENAICIDSAEVSIEFFCFPTTPALSFVYDCFEDISYSVEFEIEGEAPFVELNGRGELDGNTFFIEGIPAGTPDTFFIEDANGCVIEVPVFRECDCDADAGQFLDDSTIEVCETNGAVNAGPVQDEVVEGQNTFTFVLHDSEGGVLGNVFAQSQDGDFDFNAIDGLLCDQTYYISHVVGAELADGSVDFSDGCLSVSDGRPILWRCQPQADAGPDDDVCGLSYDLQASPSVGSGSWGSLGMGGVTFSVVNSPNSTVTVSDFGLRCFVWTETNGDCISRDTVCIDFQRNPELVPGSLQIECDETFTNYSVSFEIQFGDEDTYLVTGGGTLVGSVFTSDFIPSGEDYLFELTDDNNCDLEIISGNFECECFSAAGQLSGSPQNLCEDQLVNASGLNYDASEEQQDGNDTRAFILHDGDMNTLGNVIAMNENGAFAFDPGTMNLEQEYWIVVGVGNEMGPGMVDLEDECLSTSEGIPVRWFAYPNATIADGEREVTCLLPQIELVAENDEPFLEYQWSTANGQIVSGDNDRIAIVNAAGTYLLIVTDNRSGCSSQSEVEVTRSDDLPDVLIDAPQLLTCDRTEVTVNAENSTTGAGFEYQWNGPGIVSGADGLMPVVNEAGIYTLEITNLNNGCVNQGSIEVVEDTEAPIAIASVSSEIDCSTTEVQLSSQGSSTGNQIRFSWSPLGVQGNIVSGASDATAIADEAGTYVLEVTNIDNGCFANDTVEVIENRDVIEGLITLVENVSCFGDTDGFISIVEVEGGTAPFEYSFDGGQSFGTNFERPGLSPGQYELVVRDDRGCLWSQSFIIEEPPLLTVDLGGDQVVELGERTTLVASVNVDPSSIIEWIWDPVVDPACPNCPEQIFTPDAITAVGVTVIDSFGCAASDQIRVFITVNRNVFLPNAFSPNLDGVNDRFGVYADPARVSSIREFRVFNRWGEQVFMRENIFEIGQLSEANSWDGRFNGEDLNPGIFTWFAVIEFADGVEETFQGEVLLMR